MRKLQIYYLFQYEEVMDAMHETFLCDDTDWYLLIYSLKMILLV